MKHERYIAHSGTFNPKRRIPNATSQWHSVDQQSSRNIRNFNDTLRRVGHSTQKVGLLMSFPNGRASIRKVQETYETSLVHCTKGGHSIQKPDSQYGKVQKTYETSLVHCAKQDNQSKKQDDWLPLPTGTAQISKVQWNTWNVNETLRTVGHFIQNTQRLIPNPNLMTNLITYNTKQPYPPPHHSRLSAKQGDRDWFYVKEAVSHHTNTGPSKEGSCSCSSISRNSRRTSSSRTTSRSSRSSSQQNQKQQNQQPQNQKQQQQNERQQNQQQRQNQQQQKNQQQREQKQNQQKRQNQKQQQQLEQQQRQNQQQQNQQATTEAAWKRHQNQQHQLQQNPKRENILNKQDSKKATKT